MDVTLGLSHSRRTYGINVMYGRESDEENILTYKTGQGVGQNCKLSSLMISTLH
jgi:hypothetical protein